MPAVACDGEIDDEAARVRDEACPCAGAFSETRRFHAALADALDVALEGLLRDVACDVLARELSLAPADVAAIAVRALARYANESPVRVRMHPEEISRVAGMNVPVVADSELRRGDVAIDVRARDDRRLPGRASALRARTSAVIAQGFVHGARGGLVSASVPAARIGDAVEIATQPEPIGGRICAVDGARATVCVYDADAGHRARNSRSRRTVGRETRARNVRARARCRRARQAARRRPVARRPASRARDGSAAPKRTRCGDRAVLDRRARDRRAACAWTRRSRRHFRLTGRRKEHVVGSNRLRRTVRCGRRRTHRRARSRGAAVDRRAHRSCDDRLRDQRSPGGRARPRGGGCLRSGRSVARTRSARAARARQPRARCRGVARDRRRRRRKRRPRRLSAAASLPIWHVWSRSRGRRRADRSRWSQACSATATIAIPSAMRRARCSTATSCSRGNSPTRDAFPRSTCSPVRAGRCRRLRPPHTFAPKPPFDARSRCSNAPTTRGESESNRTTRTRNASWRAKTPSRRCCAQDAVASDPAATLAMLDAVVAAFSRTIGERACEGGRARSMRSMPLALRCVCLALACLVAAVAPAGAKRRAVARPRCRSCLPSTCARSPRCTCGSRKRLHMQGKVAGLALDGSFESWREGDRERYERRSASVRSERCASEASSGCATPTATYANCVAWSRAGNSPRTRSIRAISPAIRSTTRSSDGRNCAMAATCGRFASSPRRRTIRRRDRRDDVHDR